MKNLALFVLVVCLGGSSAFAQVETADPPPVVPETPIAAPAAAPPVLPRRQRAVPDQRAAAVLQPADRRERAAAFLQSGQLKLTTEFTNDWTAYAGGGDALPYYDDRELRTFTDPDKKYLHHGHEPFLFAGFTSSRQSVWSVGADLAVTYFGGGPTYTATITQTIHPSSRFELQLVTDYTDARGEQHWLETQGDTPIVGLRKLRQLSQIVRAAYAFTANLTLQAYTQVLLASWHYRDLESYVDNDTLSPGATADVTSFSANNASVNGVLRWEILPGSTLYAVYTRGAFTDRVFHDDATLSRRSVSALIHAPADDVVQIKLAWMFR